MAAVRLGMSSEGNTKESRGMGPINLQVAQTEDSTESRLSAIWQENLGLESIATNQNYFDLGGDSSLAVRMFAEIEKVFKVKLPLATLYETPTIEELARVLRGETSTSGWSPLVTIQPEGSRPPLFCFHGAGGNVLIYRDLSRHLGLDQPFYGLQCQGLDGSLPPLTTVEEMAALYIKEIRRTQPHGPYFLGGYCGGGTIAYEAAQQLQADGEHVALLALFDTTNWSKIPITFWSKGTYTCQRLVFHAASVLSLDIRGVSEFLREKTEVLRSRIPVWRGMLLARFSKNPEAASSTAMVLGRIWQINDDACWRYVPKPYPGTVTDFRPSTQYRIFDKPDLKWDRLAQGGQEVIVLPVYPASMLLEPFVKHLAAALTKSVDRALDQASDRPIRGVDSH
jgi:thioesterase domain-containing protein/acyl carrier protein